MKCSWRLRGAAARLRDFRKSPTLRRLSHRKSAIRAVGIPSAPMGVTLRDRAEIRRARNPAHHGKACRHSAPDRVAGLSLCRAALFFLWAVSFFGRGFRFPALSAGALRFGGAFGGAASAGVGAAGRSPFFLLPAARTSGEVDGLACRRESPLPPRCRRPNRENLVAIRYNLKNTGKLPHADRIASAAGSPVEIMVGWRV